MTKKERILNTYERLIGVVPYTKLSKAVAAEVGTTDSYVRTVARQRLGRGQSEAELRYLASPLGRATRRRHNMAYAKKEWEAIKADPSRHNAYCTRRRAWFKAKYNSDPEFRARHIAHVVRSRTRQAEARAS